MRYIVFSLFLICSILAFSQDTTNKKGFNVNNGTLTKEVIVLEDSTYNVYITKNQSKYVILVSKKNTLYPLWIGTETTETIKYKDKNYKIRISKNNKKFFIIKGENSIYCKYIKDE